MARRKIAPRFGDVFEIPLSDGDIAYGHVLRGNLVGFYDVKSAVRLPVEKVVRNGVAFRIVCAIDAIQGGKWPIVGNASPPSPMVEPIRFWRSTAPGFIFMYEWRANESDEEQRVTETEIVGLEESVIWSSFAVVERLELFFRGERDPRVVIG
ncbi:immunity 26/phosphotriesterase HocA family protein [Pendulispora brunnea]|uniref:Immunity 26/phosphotriesterase HocA family protein n=1 Tax=Pendulispora brunnea TaxID=2905690 RepID=A0ABZ2KRB5_9BACT